MPITWKHPRGILLPLVSIILICSMPMGCLHGGQPDDIADEPAPARLKEINRLKAGNTELKKALVNRDQQIRELKQEIAGLKIEVWEYEAVVNDLRSRSNHLQKRIDTAIIDVVRAKAKLRSLESKAEAASTIAEAEIAVKTLKRRMASSDQVILDEVATADQFLAMSTREFKARNFGGALYLANQTKGQVQAVQDRLSSESIGQTLDGETMFAKPLPLKVLKNNANLRRGPGLDQKISGRLNKGTFLLGHSFKGKWIRVETQEGTGGWIFQSLVGAR